MEDWGFHQTVGRQSKDHRVCETENPFDRLPDELIISHIFDKICDAKSLFSSSLVSKRFSSFVYQSKVVSIQIPLQIPPLESNSTALLTTADKYLSDLATKFLVKFTSMRTLYVEFDYSGGGAGNCDICSSANKEPIVKWKIDLGSASFIMFFARSLDDIEEIVDDKIGADVFELMGTCFLHHLKDAFVRFSLMKILVLLLPESIQNVVVRDSKKQGGFIVGENQLVEVEMIKRLNVGNFLSGRGAVKYWHAPLLKLPISGSVMKRVNVIRYKEKWAATEDDLLVVNEAFQGEEDKLYGEAVRELLIKKKIGHGYIWIGYF